MKTSFLPNRVSPGTLLLLFLTAAIAILWLLPVGYVDDDLAYCRVVTAVDFPTDYMACEGREIKTLSDALTSCYNHYVYVYGRLADKIMILSTLLPAWLTNCLCGLCIGLMTCLITVCGRASRRTWLAAVGIVLMWVMLPWYDLHSERAYIFNYVLSCCFALIFIRLYSTDKGGAWAYAAAVAAGMSHEVFGLSVLLWIAVDALCRRSLRGRRLRLALTVLVAYVFIMFSPGVWLRFFDDNMIINSSEIGGVADYLARLKLLLSRLTISLAPIIISLIITLIALLRHRLRWRDELPWMAVAASSPVLALFFLNTGRLIWLSTVACIVLLLRVGAAFDLHLRLPRLCRYILLGLAAAIYCIWGMQLAAAQRRLSAVHDSINAHLAAGRGPVAEATIPDYHLEPWYISSIVVPIEGRYMNSSFVRAKYWGYGSMVIYAPDGYADKTLEQWPKLPGDNNIYGANGCYYTPVRCGKPALTLTFGDYLPTASPVDRAIGLLRGYTRTDRPCRHTALNYYVEAGEVAGEPVYAVFLGDKPRALECREILRVDSLQF